MSAEHTPGPWKWWTSCSYRRLGSEATGHDGDVLHGVVQRSDNHPDVHFPNGGVTGPDARLIAAAPELLGALKDAIELIESLDGKDNSCDPMTDISDLRAVVAKAIGVKT